VLRLSDSLDVAWRTDLVSAPVLRTTVYTGGLRWDSGSLVVAGRTEVGNTPPTMGCCWSGGLITTLSSQGRTQWQQTVTLTRYTEYFSACYVVGPHVYAVGGAATYQSGSKKQVFGYGLITKVDRGTGAVLANFTVGDRRHRSAFQDLLVHTDHAYCLGWTHELVTNGGYQSWYVEVDLAPAPALQAAAMPVVPAGDVAAPATDVLQGQAGGGNVD